MHVISVAAQKGGVGKTTTSVNLATALRERGQRPLVIDFDAQMNATDWLMGRVLEDDEASVFDSLATWGTTRADDFSLAELARPSDAVGVDFVPASSKMAGYSFDVVQEMGETYPLQLHYRLQELKAQSGPQSDYDLCLIDCPPSLGTPVIVALSASDEVIAPVTTDNFSMKGLDQLFQTVEQVQETSNALLGVLGLLINNIDKRRRLANDMVEVIEEKYGTHVFETVVPWRAKIVDVATLGQDLYDVAPGGDAAEFYRRLADETVTRIQQRSTTPS